MQVKPMNQNNQPLKPRSLIHYLLLALAQCMVAVNIVGSKYLITASIPILFLITARFTIATCILMGLHFLWGAKAPLKVHLKTLEKQSWKLIFAQAISAGVLFNVLMLWGLKYTNANIAGIITSALPAIVVVMAWLLLDEKISMKKLWCVVLATLGLVVISAADFKSGRVQGPIWGSFIVILALIPEAAYYVLTKIKPIQFPVFLLSALMNGINAVILIPLMLIEIHWNTLHFTEFQLMILGFVGLSSGLFYVFWFLGSKEVETSTASLLTAVMPVATLIIAWLTLGEKITLVQFGGMVLVALSIIVCA